MKKNELSSLEILDEMTKENNQGIRMSVNICDVKNVEQGTIVGFGIERIVGDDAMLQYALGGIGKYMFSCFAVNRAEFEKTKKKIIHLKNESSQSRMYERFDQLHCAQIENLYWLMCQYDNGDLQEMLCFMGKDNFESCFPGILSNPYSANIQDYPDEILITLSSAGFTGLLAQVTYPQMTDFELKEDGDYKSCSINRNYSRFGYVYAENKEDLLSKIEIQSKEMTKYWISEFKSK